MRILHTGLLFAVAACSREPASRDANAGTPGGGQATCDAGLPAWTSRWTGAASADGLSIRVRLPAAILGPDDLRALGREAGCSSKNDKSRGTEGLPEGQSARGPFSHLLMGSLSLPDGGAIPVEVDLTNQSPRRLAVLVLPGSTLGAVFGGAAELAWSDSPGGGASLVQAKEILVVPPGKTIVWQGHICVSQGLSPGPYWVGVMLWRPFTGQAMGPWVAMPPAGADPMAAFEALRGSVLRPEADPLAGPALRTFVRMLEAHDSDSLRLEREVGARPLLAVPEGWRLLRYDQYAAESLDGAMLWGHCPTWDKCSPPIFSIYAKLCVLRGALA
jgi:hypothetical protein